MLERLPELVPGPVDVGLDRAERQVERSGDFFVGTAFDVPQQNAGSVFGPEAGDGAFNGRAQLLGLHLLQGILGVVADIEARRLDGVGGTRVR